MRGGYRLISPRRWLQRLVFWGGAAAVGLAATIFAVGAQLASEGFHALRGASAWLPLLVMPAGLALVALITRRLFPGTQGSGIPQTLAALELPDPERHKLLSLRIAFGKMVLTMLGLLCGASVGREGPTVQVGASIMHAFGRRGRFLRPDMQRGLIIAGGAAGVAAAFNTPLAGIVFALEELSRAFEQRTNGLILSAVILAGVTALALVGNYTYFGRSTASLGSIGGWGAVLLCGLGGGLLGGLFSRTLIAAGRGLPGRLGEFARERPIRFAAACGLVLALLGLMSGGTTYGTGYEESKALVEGAHEVPASFGLLKFAATIVSYLSGIPGGIFAPSLAVGAGLGLNLSALAPGVPLSAIVLLGMVGYFTGVVQAPLTAFIIVMEMTANHDMVLPLMATAFIAQGASRMVCRKPLYKAMAEAFLARQPATARLPEPPSAPGDSRPPPGKPSA
ncbi:MAG: chloride channel protein [Betaproteobacteria bacterium]|nr:chloride channel protein [Betaproteobacteria bacterium]